MADTNKIIQQLLKTIEEADSKFSSSLPRIQKEAFAKVIELANLLDVRSNGSIKVSTKNLKLISKIKQEIDKVVYSKSYQKSLDEFKTSFDKIESLQQAYFSNVATTFSPGTLFAEIKLQAVDSVVSSLGKEGLSVNITNQVRQILRTNITTGAKFNDLVEQMRVYLTDTKGGDGALVRYSKTITTDSLNQYSAEYDAAATDDLGLEFYEYTGSLIKTSRPFCKELIGAKNEGMRYIHRSQFKQLLHGNINGKKVALSDKTGLPYGMREGTNESNFQVLRGGYQCGHQLKPVSSAIVPKEVRAKFE